MQLRNFGEFGEDKRIQQSLLLSYMGLSLERQTMFLDIACMLLGKQRQLAAWVVQGTRGASGFSASLDLKSLIDASLVDCEPDGTLSMHDTIASMAHYIIRQPGSIHGHVYHILPLDSSNRIEVRSLAYLLELSAAFFRCSVAMATASRQNMCCVPPLDGHLVSLFCTAAGSNQMLSLGQCRGVTRHRD